MTAVALFPTLPALTDQAHRLAAHYDFDLDDAPRTPQLRWDGHSLQLALDEDMSPLQVDFSGGRVGYRLRTNEGRGQPLARAVGARKEPLPDVLDLTAGFGRDAFFLASLGCRVTLLERSALMYALLDDGLRRARENELCHDIAARMTLIHSDSRHYLDALAEEARPQVCYLDPMYPERTKSALVKKEMRLLRELVGADEDAGDVLALALAHARQRVVVKRPRKAPPLPGPRPVGAVQSKNTRYDIYAPRS